MLGCRDWDLDLELYTAPPRPAPAVRAPVADASAQALERAERAARRERERAELAARAVQRIREQSLSISAPAELPKRLAFGKRFLIQARGSAVLRFDAQSGNELTRDELGPIHAVLSLPHGSVLALATQASFRFDPAPAGRKEALRIPIWPGARIEAAPNAPDRVFLFDALSGKVERRVLFPGDFAPFEESRELPEYRGGALTALRDGSFCYLARGALYRGVALGPKRRLQVEPPHEARSAARGAGWSTEALDRVFRLRAAESPGRVWALDAQGAFWLLELGTNRVRAIGGFRTELAPIDFAVVGGRLALVSVLEGQGPRQFRLHVFDSVGQTLFERDLGSARASHEADWVERILAEFELAVSSDPPRVAIGSSSGLRLWALDTGRLLGGPPVEGGAGHPGRPAQTP